MTPDTDLKPKALTGDLLKRVSGQVMIVGFIMGALALAAGNQHAADRLTIENARLEQRIASSCDVLGRPPGDACRAEIKRLHDEALRREGAALVLPDPIEPQKTETPDAPVVKDAERDRIRRCLRDINRVLDGQARRAASCRRT